MDCSNNPDGANLPVVGGTLLVSWHLDIGGCRTVAALRIVHPQALGGPAGAAIK